MPATLVSRVADLSSASLNIASPDEAPAEAAPAPAVKVVQERLLRTDVVAPTQPDIAYRPDEVKCMARTARRPAENPNLAKTPLRDGFPQKHDSQHVYMNDYVFDYRFRQVFRAHIPRNLPPSHPRFRPAWPVQGRAHRVHHPRPQLFS
jgi:hypothetical protein